MQKHSEITNTLKCTSNIQLKVMSFNVKRDYVAFGKRSWKFRVDLIDELITQIQPDIIGTQELTYHNLQDMKKRMTAYECVGTGRGGGIKGEYTAIFYRKDKFKLVEDKTFWLSPTPNRKSRAWLSFFPRICTSCKLSLLENEEQVFTIYNTHLDHLSIFARINSLKLISQEIYDDIENNPAPVLLMGDFNATPKSKTLRKWYYEHLKLNNIYQNLNDSEIGRSYHGYKGKSKGNPIDYIFASSHFIINDVTILREKIRNNYVSDHYPIIAKLEI